MEPCGVGTRHWARRHGRRSLPSPLIPAIPDSSGETEAVRDLIPSPVRARSSTLHWRCRIRPGIAADRRFRPSPYPGHFFGLMPIPFSSEDLGRIFEPRTLTKGRSLILLGAVEVTLDDPSITAVVEHVGWRRNATITPSLLGRRVVFVNQCSCGQPACLHLAAASLAALDRFPQLRKPVQTSLLDTLTAAPAEERQVLTFELSPGQPPNACVVTTVRIGERTGRRSPTTPA